VGNRSFHSEGGEEAVIQSISAYLEGSMAKTRAAIRFLFAVASRILSVLVRVAKRLAAPGAGPKVVSG